jgi:hypothetical protein
MKEESVCITVCLVGNTSVKMFQRQRRFVEGVVLYAVRVVSNERRLVLPRTCFFFVRILIFVSITFRLAMRHTTSLSS